jgi:hypothetical protein
MTTTIPSETQTPSTPMHPIINDVLLAPQNTSDHCSLAQQAHCLCEQSMQQQQCGVLKSTMPDHADEDEQE